MPATGTLTVAKKTPKPADDAPAPTAMTTVKMRVDLHRMLRTLAGYHGEEIADYIDQVFRPVVLELWNQMGRDIQGGK